MYNNRYIILILKIIINNIYAWSSNSSHCLIHLCHHQPSIEQKQVLNIHCNYDILPWQHAERSRSIIFKSYTLISISYLPCQELCSSVRYCAGVQFQIHGLYRHRCRLLRSTKPWDLVSSLGY